jgi:hypothetical protein
LIVKATSEGIDKFDKLYSDFIDDLLYNVNYPLWIKRYPNRETFINAINKEVLFIVRGENGAISWMIIMSQECHEKYKEIK